MPDLIIYASTAILPLIGLFISESYTKQYPNVLKIISIVSFLLLFAIDIAIPLINIKNQLRPAYTTHLIIACYVFFNIPKTYVSCIMGLVVTITHILILAFVTYEESDVLYQRVSYNK